MNKIFPWILAAGLASGLAATFLASHAKDAELVRLREDSQQAAATRTELDATKNQFAAANEELKGLRADKEELLRLRNEVHQLRTEKLQLSQQVQSAQTEAQRAQAQVAEVTATTKQRLAQLVAENKPAPVVTPAAMAAALLNACVNNLRQLDAAKQQWALEKNKTADAIPTAQEIAPYLKDNQVPVCPAGGQYSLNALSSTPTCSTPGHVLP